MSLPSGTQSSWASGTQQVITNVSRRLTKDSIVIANDRTTTASTPPTISTYQATYYLSANQNLSGPGGAGTTDITFNTLAPWNNDGGFITHVPGSKDFTVDTPGLYQLEWNVSVLANGSTWTNTLKQISVDITRTGSPEAITIAQNTTIPSGNNYGQSLSATFSLEAGDVINCRIVNIWIGTPNIAQAIGGSGIDLNTWFTWRFIPSADTTIENENSVLSCYADNANGGSIYINLALDPASHPITVGWEVLSFEPPTTALNAFTPLALVEDYVPSDLLTTTRSFFRGTDYYVYAFGPEGVANGPVGAGLTTSITTEFMSSVGDTTPIPGSSAVSTTLESSVIDGFVAYFIYGGDTRANSYSLLPTGSVLAPFLSQGGSIGAITTNSRQLPAPYDFVRLVADIDSAGAPNSYINENASALPTITLNADNSITIDNWAYGPWTGATLPSSSFVASDGIGGVRFTFVGPPPGPPAGSLVFYDNTYCFTATDLTNLQTVRTFTIPASQTRDFVNGDYRCFIDAGNCPTLESAPGSATYNQATWVAQAKFSAPIVVPFTFLRSAPLTPEQGASLVLLTPGPTTINVVADINNALDPSINPPVLPLVDVVFQYALITSGTPVVVLSINPTTNIGGIVAGQFTGLANQTTYQVRVGVTNNAPVGSPITIFTDWQLVTTLPFAPLVGPSVIQQSWRWPITFQNVVAYSVDTSACGGVTPYTSIGVTYSFDGPIVPGRGTFLPLTLTAPNTYTGDIPCPPNTPWTLYTSAQVVDSGGQTASTVPGVLPTSASAPQALPPIGKVTDTLILPGVQTNIFPFVNVTLPPIGELPINYFCSASFKNDFSTVDFPNAEMVPAGTLNPDYTNRFVFKSFPTLPVDKYVFFRTNTFNAIGPQLNPSGLSPTFVAAYGNVGPLLPAPVPTGGGTNTITITLTATDTTPFGANTQVQVKYINTILTTGLINLAETAPGSGIYSGTLSSVGPGAVIPDTYDFAFSVIVTNETVTQYLSAQSGGIVLTA